MAADILIYDSDIVPVGEDQVAAHRGGPRPGGQLQPRVRRDLRAAQGEDSGQFGLRAGHRRPEDVEELRQHAGRCSRSPRRCGSRSCGSSPTRGPWSSPRSRRATTLFSFTRSLPAEAEREAMAATYRRGGFGYGEVKKALADLAVDYFAAARQQPRGVGGPSGAGPRDSRRRRRHGPPQGRRGPRARRAGLRRAGAVKLEEAAAIIPVPSSRRGAGPWVPLLPWPSRRAIP